MLMVDWMRRSQAGVHVRDAFHGIDEHDTEATHAVGDRNLAALAAVTADPRG
jgi:hypothetical protein